MTNCFFLLRLLLVYSSYVLQEIISTLSQVVPQLKRLVAAFPPRLPGFASWQLVGFVVDKAALGQVFPEYFGFSCQSFHQFLHHHNHQGLAQ
jgi:hypothetical protein